MKDRMSKHQEYHRLLKTTASAVDELIEDSVNLNYFKSQIRRLCDMAEARGQAVMPLMEEAYTHQEKKTSETTSKQQDQCLEQFCEKLNKDSRDETYVLMSEPLDGYFNFKLDSNPAVSLAGFRWALPLDPPNSLVWFPGVVEDDFFANNPEFKPTTLDDESMCDAVILALIHNLKCSSPATKVEGRSIYGDDHYESTLFDRDGFFSDLQDKLLNPDHAERVRSALRRVRRVTADLALKGGGNHEAQSKKKKAKRRRRSTTVRPLTELQRQALELSGTHNGKVKLIAEEMNITSSTVTQHLQSAYKKLPYLAPKKTKGTHRVQRLPTDKRGQSTVTDGAESSE